MSIFKDKVVKLLERKDRSIYLNGTYRDKYCDEFEHYQIER